MLSTESSRPSLAKEKIGVANRAGGATADSLSEDVGVLRFPHGLGQWRSRIDGGEDSGIKEGSWHRKTVAPTLYRSVSQYVFGRATGRPRKDIRPLGRRMPHRIGLPGCRKCCV